MAQLAAAAPTQVRPSGRLTGPVEVRNSGRLPATGSDRNSGRLASEEGPPSAEGARTPYGLRKTSNTGSRPGSRNKKSRKDVDEEETRRRRKILIPLLILALAAAVALLAPATQMITWQVDAQTSISTLTTFRSLPSKLPGKTVDQCINEFLDESRKGGDFISASGWSIKPIRFDKTKFLLGFSFEEKGGVRTAEWLADVDSGTFTPKNDLAAQIYGSK